MTKLNPTILAAEDGYQITGVKNGGSEAAMFTIEKDGRKLVIDQVLIDDIQRRSKPVENPDENSPLKAVQ